MPKWVYTESAVEDVKKVNAGILHGQALEKMREELYKGFPLHFITLPELAYDSKTDRNTVKFELSGKKHTLKINPALIALLTQLFAFQAQQRHIYYGFKVDNDGIVDDFVAEVW